jgi:hypothetical protein
MTKFYICTTGIAKGPYQLSEIEKLDINTNDLVWADEYRATRKALQVPEFKNYFRKKQVGEKGSRIKNPGYQRVVLAMLLSALVVMVGYYFYAVAG